MELISIITINRNNADGLDQTIQSVVGQSFKNIEYIVIDGASTDDSVNIIEKFNSNIKYWVSEKDSGIYDAMNKGIAKATGEYVLFLNSGDYLCNGKTIEAVFSKEPKVDLIACDMIFEKNNKIKDLQKQPDQLSFFYMMRTSLWHPATFIKRKLFNDFGLYNVNYKIAADYDFFLRVTMVEQVTYSHIPVTLSVYNTEGISSNPQYHQVHKDERMLIQQSYFSNPIIEASQEHTLLVESYPFKLITFIKRHKTLYQFLNLNFKMLLSIKRIFWK
jgi:glycosyltransferase involved in cell wall biosynthesis